MRVNAPARFLGSEAQKEANRESHRFDWEYARCMDCDSRPWGIAAEWPCGASVPRQDYENGEAVLMAFAAGAAAYGEAA